MVMPYLGAPMVPGTEKYEKPAASKVETTEQRAVFLECNDKTALILLGAGQVELAPSEAAHLALWLTKAAEYLRSVT